MQPKMPRRKAPDKSTEKSAQPEFATETDIERAKQIAYLLQMKYGWQIDSASIQQLAIAIRQTEPPKWPDAKPVKLYKPRKRSC
jgi:hypothetical protein